MFCFIVLEANWVERARIGVCMTIEMDWMSWTTWDGFFLSFS